MARIFILDNLDSFTFNLAQGFASLGAEVTVRRGAGMTPHSIDRLHPTHVVISPGPMRPADHPSIRMVLAHYMGRLPVLGICLGMQGINDYCGGLIKRDSPPVHGKTSAIYHEGVGLFANIPRPMIVARYHSLVVDHLGQGLTIDAMTEDRRIMAVSHRELPVWGVQFHPESFLTEHGLRLMNNFVEMRCR